MHLTYSNKIMVAVVAIAYNVTNMNNKQQMLIAYGAICI